MINKLVALGSRSIVQCALQKVKTPYIHPDRVLGVHDFLYIIEGKWSIAIADEVFNLGPDDAIILPAGVHHYGVGPSSPDLRYIFIHFSPDDEDEYLEDRDSELGSLEEVKNSHYIMPVVHCGANPNILDVLNKLLDAFWTEKPNRTIHMSILLDLLLCELADANNEDAPNSEAINKVLRAFRMSPDRFFSVDEAAQIAGMSSRSFAEWFKKVTGQSSYRYQIDFKLELACVLLWTDPAKTMQQIADTFGFYDAFQFSKLFKQRYGFPPSDLRKKGVVTVGPNETLGNARSIWEMYNDMTHRKEKDNNEV